MSLHYILFEFANSGANNTVRIGAIPATFPSLCFPDCYRAPLLMYARLLSSSIIVTKAPIKMRYCTSHTVRALWGMYINTNTSHLHLILSQRLRCFCVSDSCHFLPLCSILYLLFSAFKCVSAVSCVWLIMCEWAA